MDASKSNKLLFIVANPGAGAHRLGRIVSCLDNVYWYSHELNGINPWDATNNDIVTGKNISKYHYDRLIGSNMVPLIGERIERYWEHEDFHTYYRIWNHYMNSTGATGIMNSGQYISWVVHDSPENLLERFPNCKIIHLKDPDNIVERYSQTTALFPLHIRNTQLKPKYLNNFAKDIDQLINLNPNPTHRDYWMWVRYDVAFYDTSKDSLYTEHIKHILSYNEQKNIPEVLNVSWDSLDINCIKKYLNSNSIDINYKLLCI